MPVTATSDKSSIVDTVLPPANVDKSTVLPLAIVNIFVPVLKDNVWLSVSVNIPAKSTVLPPEIESCVPDNDSDCDPPPNKLVVSVKSETSAGIVGLPVKSAYAPENNVGLLVKLL